MKVLLDVDAIAPPLTGIGRYALALAMGLQQSPRVESVDFFTLGRRVDHIEDLLREDQPMTRLRRNIPAKQVIRKLYHLFSRMKFQLQTRSRHYDIFHSPNYRLMPFKGMTISTFHDLSLERYPQFHPPERLVWWENAVRPVAKRAGHLITDSEFVRQEIMGLLGVAPDRISAIPLGVDDAFKPHDVAECREALSKYGLNYDKYCLAVATIEPRKNYERLLQAYELLPPAIRNEYPLVIVGSKGWLSENIHAAIDRLVARGTVIKLGYVAEADLPKLYAGASLFAYPSLYEGFGLPVLEAMASGTAVLSSNASSIPEVAGNACVLVDPYSVEAISEGLRQLLDDPGKRADLEEAGLHRAKQFTWGNCVDQTISLYERLV
jgi:glycosyltransferase involved in cell wall biosynthesis